MITHIKNMLYHYVRCCDMYRTILVTQSQHCVECFLCAVRDGKRIVTTLFMQHPNSQDKIPDSYCNLSIFHMISLIRAQ